MVTLKVKVDVPNRKIRQMPNFWENMPEHRVGRFCAYTYMLVPNLGSRCREEMDEKKVYTNTQSAYVASRLLALQRDRDTRDDYYLSEYGVGYGVLDLDEADRKMAERKRLAEERGDD